MTLLQRAIDDSVKTFRGLADLEGPLNRAAQMVLGCLTSGHKVLTCGNGGSAADALHLAEELVGRYKSNRRALPAVCLNADVTALTCIGNDFGYEWVFSRQVEALACPGDVLVGFSTSGRSANVLAAFRRAREIGVSTIFVGGKDGGQTRGVCDHEIIVPSFVTARIQEVHTVVLHQWLEAIEVTDWQFSPIGRSRECEAPTAL